MLNHPRRLALERNFLAYLRTALSFGNAGIIIAQLFRLQPAESESQLSFYSAGPPLAGLFVAGSLLLTIIGSWRFWNQQEALMCGKVQAGGWEVWATVLVCFSVCVRVELAMVRWTWTINRFHYPAALDTVCDCHRCRRFEGLVIGSLWLFNGVAARSL